MFLCDASRCLFLFNILTESTVENDIFSKNVPVDAFNLSISLVFNLSVPVLARNQMMMRCMRTWRQDGERRPTEETLLWHFVCFPSLLNCFHLSF